MKIFPAIDLKDNKCVRLSKGKDESSKIFNVNPVDQAKYFEQQGCERIHIVDLDAAFGRNDINLPWEKNDLPELHFPNNSEVSNCVRLVTELVNWIRTYEENVANILGLDYRKSTLYEWQKIVGSIIPAKNMISEWRFVETEISEESPLIFVNKKKFASRFHSYKPIFSLSNKKIIE